MDGRISRNITGLGWRKQFRRKDLCIVVNSKMNDYVLVKEARNTWDYFTKS